MGITMIKVETNSDEATLFLRLVGRGRRALVPYYQSVETYDEKAGLVIFSRLDCSPADRFKVGVAGNLLLTTKSFEREIISWLSDWGLVYSLSEEVFDNPKNVMNFFQNLREKTKLGREEIIEKIRIGLKKQGEAAEIVSLDEYELNRVRGKKQ